MKISNKLISIILALALVIGIFYLYKLNSSDPEKLNVWDTIQKNKEVKIGYMMGAPYLMRDKKTGELQGVCFELTNEVFKRLNIKPVWAEEVGWGTAIEGLKYGRYQITGSLMWPTPERSKEAVFSISPFNSVVYPYVRFDDQRFDNDLNITNSSEIVISTLDGEVAQNIAKEDFPKAKTISLTQLSNFSDIFLNIVNKKADITFVDPSTVKVFSKNNPNKIKRVGEKPIRQYENVYAFKKGEAELQKQINNVLQEMIKDGTVENILNKYDSGDIYKVNKN